MPIPAPIVVPEQKLTPIAAKANRLIASVRRLRRICVLTSDLFGYRDEIIEERLRKQEIVGSSAGVGRSSTEACGAGEPLRSARPRLRAATERVRSGRSDNTSMTGFIKPLAVVRPLPLLSPVTTSK